MRTETSTATGVIRCRICGREERVVVQHHDALHLVVLHVVEEVHEADQHEQRPERDHDQAELPEVRPDDVAVEQAGQRQREPGDAQHHHLARPPRRSARALARARRHRRALSRARPPGAADHGQERLVVRGVERVERGLALAQHQQHDRHDAEHDVRGPHRDERRHHPGVAGLLAQADQHVVDEDDADAQAERGRARLLLAAQRQPEPEQAEHDAGAGDRELLVELDAGTGCTPAAPCPPGRASM